MNWTGRHCTEYLGKDAGGKECVRTARQDENGGHTPLAVVVLVSVVDRD